MSTQGALKRSQDEFSRGVGVSIVAHVLIFGFFLIKTVLTPSTPLEIQNAIRVDIAALPDKLPPEAVAPKPAAPEVPEAKAPPMEEKKTELTAKNPVVPEKPAARTPEKPKPDTVNLDRTKKKQQEALNKLKSMAALEKIREETRQEAAAAERKRLEALAAASREQAGVAKIKGQRVSPGASLTGIEKLQFEQYWAVLDQHIKQYWQLPEWLANKGLRSIVLVRIDATGRLLERRVSNGSGTKEHDDSALETIDRANPFPAPPDKFIDKVSVEGILIKFGE